MTSRELLALWGERDDLYAKRRHEISEDAIEAVRSWRRRESSEVEPKARAGLFSMASSWVPPSRSYR